MAAAAAELEQPLPLLKYQTWVLKVSMHCKGCQRKVKRVLQTIEGVYTTELDLKQHKVTVTGDIEAETLIRKLLKSGKHAELWPNMKPALSKPSKGAAGAASDASDDGSDDDEGACDVDGHKPHVQHVEAPTAITKDGHFAKDVPLVVDKSAIPGGGHPMEKPPNAAQGGGAAAGAKKKKKKKKKKNSSVTFAPAAGTTIEGKPAGQAGVGALPASLPPPACSSPASPAAAPNHPRPVLHAANCSISQPSTSRTTTSYYAPPPPVAAYASVLPAMYESPASRYSSESYHIFSDENANACSVM